MKKEPSGSIQGQMKLLGWKLFSLTKDYLISLMYFSTRLFNHIFY